MVLPTIRPLQIDGHYCVIIVMIANYNSNMARYAGISRICIFAYALCRHMHTTVINPNPNDG